MNAKQNYVAPEMELVEVRVESHILTDSMNGGSTQASLSMSGWNSTDEEAW